MLNLKGFEMCKLSKSLLRGIKMASMANDALSMNDKAKYIFSKKVESKFVSNGIVYKFTDGSKVMFNFKLNSYHLDNRKGW